MYCCTKTQKGLFLVFVNEKNIFLVQKFLFLHYKFYVHEL